MQSYRPTKAVPRGSFADGRLAVIENAFGKGRTQQVRLSNPALQARLHEGPEGRVLWVINATRQVQKATLSLNTGPASSARLIGRGRGLSPAATA